MITVDAHKGDKNWPPPLENLGFDSGHELVDERLRRIFEGPAIQGLGVVDRQRSHSHALVQNILNQVVNSPDPKGK